MADTLQARMKSTRGRSTSQIAMQYIIYTKDSETSLNTCPSDVQPGSRISEASRQLSTLVSHQPSSVSRSPLFRVEHLLPAMHTSLLHT